MPRFRKLADVRPETKRYIEALFDTARGNVWEATECAIDYAGTDADFRRDVLGGGPSYQLKRKLRGLLNEVKRERQRKAAP